MKEAFEKILERLEAESFERRIPVFTDRAEMVIDFETAKQIVQEVAEEYNGGWIPCSERLPEEREYYLVCDGQSVFIAEYADYEWRYHRNEHTKDYVYVNVTAWQPLPGKYKKVN